MDCFVLETTSYVVLEAVALSVIFLLCCFFLYFPGIYKSRETGFTDCLHGANLDFTIGQIPCVRLIIKKGHSIQLRWDALSLLSEAIKLQ